MKKKYPKNALHPSSGYKFKANPIIRYKQYWEVHYIGFRKEYGGKLLLPVGWQDMDRTWTAQDIYWEDKYDCLIVLGRA